LIKNKIAVDTIKVFAGSSNPKLLSKEISHERGCEKMEEYE
jgi:hypothetical protein